MFNPLFRMNIPIFLLRLPFLIYLDLVFGYLVGAWSKNDLPDWPPSKKSGWYVFYFIYPTDLLNAWKWIIPNQVFNVLWTICQSLYANEAFKSIIDVIPHFCVLFTCFICLCQMVNTRPILNESLKISLSAVQQFIQMIVIQMFLSARIYLSQEIQTSEQMISFRISHITMLLPMFVSWITSCEHLIAPWVLLPAIDGLQVILGLPLIYTPWIHSTILIIPFYFTFLNHFFFCVDIIESAIEQWSEFWQNREHFWIIHATRYFDWQATLAAYWLTRFFCILCRHLPILTFAYGSDKDFPVENWIKFYTNSSFETMPDLIKEVLLMSTQTILCVYAFSITLGQFYNVLERICASLLDLSDEDAGLTISSGSIIAMYFSTMAFELNLTPHSEMDQIRLTVQLLCISMLVFLWPLYQLLKKRLEQLQVDRDYSFSKQLIPLVFSAGILGACVLQTSIFYQKGIASCWTIAVLLYSIQTFFSVTCMLLQNLIYYIDYIRNVHWDQFDDYLYYIRTVPTYCQLSCSIFMFVTTAYLSMGNFEGIIKVILTGVHLYFYIYRTTLEEWKIYRDRRKAALLLRGIPHATKTELRRYSDVCAICQEDMESARMTSCRHLFHQSCLQKWMQLRNTCPMCNRVLYKENAHQIPTSNLLREMFNDEIY